MATSWSIVSMSCDSASERAASGPMARGTDLGETVKDPASGGPVRLCELCSNSVPSVDAHESKKRTVEGRASARARSQG